jgi:hypothetical protein
VRLIVVQRCERQRYARWWTSEGSIDDARVVFPEAGAIRFGVFATTHAMCPTGPLGDRFAREVVCAVRWAIQRGELRLELSGDAGVLRFTRQP